MVPQNVNEFCWFCWVKCQWKLTGNEELLIIFITNFSFACSVRKVHAACVRICVWFHILYVDSSCLLLQLYQLVFCVSSQLSKDLHHQSPTTHRLFFCCPWFGTTSSSICENYPLKQKVRWKFPRLLFFRIFTEVFAEFLPCLGAFFLRKEGINHPFGQVSPPSPFLSDECFSPVNLWHSKRFLGSSRS